MGLDLDFGMQPPHAALPPPRIPGLWSAPLQCVSAEAFERPPEGDKVLLPPSALEKLMELIPQEHMPQPLLFRISVLGTAGAGKHVGVLEFSAPEGCVVVPLWIMRSLGANDGDEMFVGTAELPKGSFAKLQPLSSEFAQLDVSPKELLERTLAGTYTTLATGDSIAVNYGGMMLELFVLELQEGGGPGRPGRPANAVCIIDADLEVDFEASAVMSEEELRRRAEAEAAVQAQAEAAVAAARAQEEAAEAARRAEAEAAAARRRPEPPERARGGGGGAAARAAGGRRHDDGARADARRPTHLAPLPVGRPAVGGARVGRRQLAGVARVGPRLRTRVQLPAVRRERRQRRDDDRGGGAGAAGDVHGEGGRGAAVRVWDVGWRVG